MSLIGTKRSTCLTVPFHKVINSFNPIHKVLCPTNLQSASFDIFHLTDLSIAHLTSLCLSVCTSVSHFGGINKAERNLFNGFIIHFNIYLVAPDCDIFNLQFNSAQLQVTYKFGYLEKAMCRGIDPVLSWANGSAPWSRRNSTTCELLSALPECAFTARWRGVLCWTFLPFISAPASRRTFSVAQISLGSEKSQWWSWCKVDEKM